MKYLAISPCFWLLVVGCGPFDPTAEFSRNQVIEDITAWIAEADENRDQRLDRSEWQALWRRGFPDVPEAGRQRQGNRDFAYYDTNGDGFVEAEELAADSVAGFDCLDTDRNGRLSSTEREAARDATCLPSRNVTE